MLIDGFLPNDSNRDEYDILMISVTNLYSKLNDEEKLIVALTFDAGYTQTVVAMIMRTSDKTISKKIDGIRKKLVKNTVKNGTI